MKSGNMAIAGALLLTTVFAGCAQTDAQRRSTIEEMQAQGVSQFRAAEMFEKAKRDVYTDRKTACGDLLEVLSETHRGKFPLSEIGVSDGAFHQMAANAGCNFPGYVFPYFKVD